MATFRPAHAVALLVAAAATACSIDVHSSESSVREEKRFTLAGGGPAELDLRTFDGTIQVRSWDRNEVLVEIERRGSSQSVAEALDVEASQEGNRVVVEARQPRGQRDGFTVGWTRESVNLTVTAPRRASLEARTGDGGIDVDDLEGTVGLNSGDGRIHASRVSGRIRARTGDGSIAIDEAAGQVDADSGDGSIEIAGRLDELNLRTGDGGVRVDLSGGSVMKSDWRVTTGEGNIRIRVPDSFNADVDAYSGDGRVRVEGLPAGDDRDEDARRTVQGRLGSGGHTLHLRSGDGSIEVTR